MQYYFDSLPYHPAPCQLESLTGYTTRLSAGNGIKVATELSLMVFGKQGIMQRRHLLDFPLRDFTLLANVSAQPEAKLRPLTFYHLLQKFGRLTTTQAMSRFLGKSIAESLRFCPVCLSDTGCHYLVWRFTMLSGCVYHACRLLDHCDHCRRPVPLLAFPPSLSVCPNCQNDLRACKVQPLQDDELKTTYEHLQDLLWLLQPSLLVKDDTLVARDIGRYFAYLRRTNKLPLVSFVNRAGLSVNDVQGIESGNFAEKGAYFSSYVRYASFFGMSLRDVIEPALTSSNHMIPRGGLFSA